MHLRSFVAASLMAVTSLAVVGVGAPAASAAPAAPATPTAAPAKDPIVVVSGLTSPEIAHWILEARFEADGYDVTIFVLPGGGLGDISVTSQALAPVVDQVMARTGASQVDIIGHSEGGIVGRYYINERGSAKVDSFVSLAAPQYGTYAGNLAAAFGIGGFCQACEQMAIGSDFLNDLNAGPDVVGDVHVTTFRTIYDIAVRPVDNAKLRDGATNVLVQGQCPLRFVDHSGFAIDGAAYDGIRDAIRHEPVRMNCFAL